jgi:hypothetical protein
MKRGLGQGGRLTRDAEYAVLRIPQTRVQSDTCVRWLPRQGKQESIHTMFLSGHFQAPSTSLGTTIRDTMSPLTARRLFPFPILTPLTNVPLLERSSTMIASGSLVFLKILVCSWENRRSLKTTCGTIKSERAAWPVAAGAERTPCRSAPMSIHPHVSTTSHSAIY